MLTQRVNTLQALSLIDSRAGVTLLALMRNRVAEQLQAIIAERNINQAELARICEMSQSRINNYMAGTRTPDLDAAIRMAQRLGVTTDYLLGVSSEAPDIGEVVLRLLELEGMDKARAEVVAETAQEALRLLLALPDEGDAPTRSRIAAQAAWQLRGGPKPLQ